MNTSTFQLRSAELSGNTLCGYAAVYDTVSLVEPGRYEMIARGALDDVLAAEGTDVVAVSPTHDMARVLGRQSAGTLRLRNDDEGLAFEIDLPDTSYANDLRALVERGDITGASFGFLPAKGGVEVRVIDGRRVHVVTNIAWLRDISPVAQPAYGGTSVSLRSIGAPTGRSQLIAARARALGKEFHMPATTATEGHADVVARLGALAEERSLTADEITEFETAADALEAERRTEAVSARARAFRAVAPLVDVAPAAPAGDTLERAFEAFLRTGAPNDDIVELRAQGEGTGSAGGYLVPDGFLARITEAMKAFGGIQDVAEVITTTTGNPLPWVTNDDTSNEGGITAEGATPSTGSDITFGQKTLGAYKYTAQGADGNPVRVSNELLQDAAFDISAFIARKLGQRIQRNVAGDFVTGTGVGQPLGIVTGLTGVEMSSGGPTYNDLIDFIHTVDPAYRQGGNCRWAFNDSSLAAIRKLTDSNGDPLWKGVADNMATGLGGGTLLGYPVSIDQGFGDIVASNGADDNWGVFGDLRAGYVIRMVRGVVVNVNPYSRMNEGQVEFSAYARMDGTQNDTSAYTALAGYTA